jgi:streptomycin 6-kinase
MGVSQLTDWQGGGLVAFWKGPGVVTLIKYSQNHMNLKVVGTDFFL